jgi:hypothetical protein
LRSVLDVEVYSLPEKYRIPVVLCDLEGKTRNEAAEQLGWAEGTVASRLARARELLGRRLARHGVPLTAGMLGFCLAETASGALPARLVESTMQAATGDGAAPAVAALTQGVLRAMFWKKVRLPLLAVLTVGLLATGVRGFVGPGVGSESSAASAAAPQAVPSQEGKPPSREVPGKAQAKEIPFKEIFRAFDGGPRKTTVGLIETPQGWKEFIQGCKEVAVRQQLERKEIDFDKEMVIALGFGPFHFSLGAFERKDCGVKKVLETEDNILVKYTVVHTDQLVDDPTFPVFVVTMPRTKKRVLFEKHEALSGG